MALWAHGGTRAARRRGRQGFGALSPYRRFLRCGPAGPVILTSSGALVCILRLHPSDLESESSERRARVCEALAQTFSSLGDGWGTWINVISRARRQYLERGVAAPDDGDGWSTRMRIWRSAARWVERRRWVQCR